MARCFCPDSTDTVEGGGEGPYCLRIERISELEGRIRELEAALRRYGMHDDGYIDENKVCASQECGPDTCDCGLDDVLKNKAKRRAKETSDEGAQHGQDIRQGEG